MAFESPNSEGARRWRLGASRERLANGAVAAVLSGRSDGRSGTTLNLRESSMKTSPSTLLASLALLAACGPMGTPDAGLTGNVTSGMSLFAGRTCNGCHGPAGEGNSTGPNITGSTTAGIGSWNLAAFTKAVREATSPSGRKYCTTMTAYPTLTDQQVADLFAFLMAQKNDTVQRGTACP